MTEIVSVTDRGVRLDIPFEACVLYHGRDSIGGLALAAEAAGFREYSTFLRAFQNTFHMSPREFR